MYCVSCPLPFAYFYVRHGSDSERTHVVGYCLLTALSTVMPFKDFEVFISDNAFLVRSFASAAKLTLLRFLFWRENFVLGHNSWGF